MKNKIITFLIVILLLVLVFITFLKLNKSKTETNNNLTHIKLAEVTHSAFYTPMYVAIEKGYFKENRDFISGQFSFDFYAVDLRTVGDLFCQCYGV